MKTHGLKGEVTLNLSLDAPDILAKDVFMIEQSNGLVPYFVETVSFNGLKCLIKFDGVNTIEQSTTLKGCSIFMDKSKRPKLKRGDFYDDELVGFDVSDKQAGSLGKVLRINNQGLNKLMEVGEKEILIPLNSPFIITISKTKKKIEVDLPDGFLDI